MSGDCNVCGLHGCVELNHCASLQSWIDDRFGGNQRAFAAAQGVQPPQVTQWIQKGFIVVGGTLYSPRRELKT